MAQQSTTQSSTADDVKLMLPLRLINQLIEKTGVNLEPLTAERLMQSAMSDTGLSDWGEDAAEFKKELEILVNSYENDARLTFFGKRFLTRTLTRWLANRLLTVNEIRKQPEIAAQPVPRPLFVTGMPRTGTTLLHRLLGQDSNARVPLLWELMWPTPPPVKAERGTDPRIQETQDILNKFIMIAPQVQTIHPMYPTEPEECTWLMEEYFAYIHANVSSHIKALLQHDLTHNYQFYRKQLQILQWRTPGDHWVLKSPFHILGLDAILRVFPDANIVITHRAPETVIGSICSMVATSYKIYSDHVDANEIGEMALYLWETAVNRMIEVRSKLDPARFYDVHYTDLMADRFGTARKVYEHFGYTYTPEMDAAGKQWLQGNPQNKHGVHRYSLEQFGLDKEIVRQHFKEYTEHYSIKAQ